MAKLDSTRLLAGALFVKLRGNARRRNLHVSITVDDIDRLMRSQDMRCAVSGVRFDVSPRNDGGRVRPLVPSVDRIDASKGYDICNVRIVCAAVNAALGDWGDSVFHAIVLGVANKHGWAAEPARQGFYPRGVVARPHKNGVRFEALVAWRGKRYFLGTFPSAEAAGEQYKRAKAALRAGQPIIDYLPKRSHP